MKYLLFALFSGILFAQNPLIDIAQMARVAYDDDMITPFESLYVHENKLYGNRLVAVRNIQADTIYIAIRGTSNFQNWISNAHIAPTEHVLDYIFSWERLVKYKKHYDHAKDKNRDWFISAFEDLRKVVAWLLKGHPNSRIIFTGHSYGGTMANLLAQNAYHQNPDLNFECHAFNAPGGRKIRINTLGIPDLPQEVLNRLFTNHVRVTDIVPMLNTHDGVLLSYPGVTLNPLDEHGMDYFLEDLINGMQPI